MRRSRATARSRSRRSRETWLRSDVTALAGGREPHNASTSRSTLTASPPEASSVASSMRRRSPASETDLPAAVTITGPRTRKRIFTTSDTTLTTAVEPTPPVVQGWLPISHPRQLEPASEAWIASRPRRRRRSHEIVNAGTDPGDQPLPPGPHGSRQTGNRRRNQPTAGVGARPGDPSGSRSVRMSDARVGACTRHVRSTAPTAGRLPAANGPPVPYWYIDAGFAAMLVMLQAIAEGLGTLLFGIPREDWPQLRAASGVPEDQDPVGAVVVGHPAPDPRQRGSASAVAPQKTASTKVAGGRPVDKVRTVPSLVSGAGHRGARYAHDRRWDTSKSLSDRQRTVRPSHSSPFCR